MILKTKNNREMKTPNTFYTIATLFLLTLTFGLNASAFNFEEEDYINDIPFDTRVVVENMTEVNDFTISFEEEDYRNDIPFNTEEVVASMTPATDSLIDFEEEAYIDDLPFDTEKVVAAYNYRKAMQTGFVMEEETYVDDIPFNTLLVAKEAQREVTPVFFSVVVTPLEF
jgi:hypothetical protein